MKSLSLLNKYAELKRQIIVLEAQMNELKPAVLEQLIPGGSVESKHYKISLKSRKSWNYRKAIITAEKKVKAMKAAAQIEGTATYTESQYIECKLLDV